MNQRITTKKLPVPWSLKTKKQKRGHMIPNILGQDTSVFLNLESLKTERVGTIVYLGIEVGTPEIEARLKEIVPNFEMTEAARTTLERYLVELQRFKIGNVVEILPTAGNAPSLVLVDEHSLSKWPDKLP